MQVSCCFVCLLKDLVAHFEIQKAGLDGLVELPYVLMEGFKKKPTKIFQ